MKPLQLILVNLFIRVASAASGQLFAFVLADRIGSRVAAGSLIAGAIGLGFFATELVGAPVAGHVADASGQLRVLKWGPLFGTGAVLLGAAAALRMTSVTVLAGTLVAARLVEGASAACAVPTTLVLLSRATESQDASGGARLRLMGLFEIASLGGIIVGYLLAGVIWDALGGAAFLILPLVYLMALAFVRGNEPAVSPPRRAAFWTTLQELIKEKGSAGFTIAWLAVNAVVGVWVQQAPYLLKLPTRSPTQSLVGGYAGRTIGFVFALWGVTFLLGIALWSFVAPRWPRRQTLYAALIGMLAVVASLALVNHGGPLWLLLLAAAAVLVESGFTPAAFAHLADITDAHEESRGGAMGLYSMLLGLGQLIGAAIGAPFAARWQMDGVLAATALLAAVGLLGVTRMRASDAHAPSTQT